MFLIFFAFYFTLILIIGFIPVTSLLVNYLLKFSFSIYKAPGLSTFYSYPQKLWVAFLFILVL
jgi:hypothetical protein